MRWRFTLKHQLAVEDLQFTNNEFEVSITGWSQIGGAGTTLFSWNNPSSARASGATPNTAAIGQQSPHDAATGWPPGTYTIRIKATNTSTGGSAPFQSLLNIWGSDAGVSLDTAITYTGTGTWDVGAGEVTRDITFTLEEHHSYLFFKFTKVGTTTGYNVVFTINSIVLLSVNGATDDHEISEPDGWDGATIKLERDNEFASLIEHYLGDAGGAFNFYGENAEVDGGINFLKSVEEAYGFDANVELLVEFAPDDINFNEIFSGLLELSGKNEMKDNKMQVPVIRDDFWVKFMNRLDTPVNMSDLVDLDGNTVDGVVPATITLTDQYINQFFVGFLPEPTYSFPGGIGGNDYIQVDFDDTNENMSAAQKAVCIDEIEEHIAGYPIIDNPSRPSPSFDFEFPGDVVVNNLTLIARNATDDTTTHLDADIKAYLFDGVTEHLLTRTDYLGSDGTTRRSRFVYSGGTLTDIKSLTVYFYNDSGSTSTAVGLLFDDQVEIGVPGTFTTKFDFHVVTKFEETTAQGYLLHDLIHGVLARLGLGNDPLYSEFLGATFTNSKQYAEDGCGSTYVIVKGLQVRGYTLEEKPFFISFKQIWDGINPILNLGLGYEDIVSGGDPNEIQVGTDAGSKVGSGTQTESIPLPQTYDAGQYDFTGFGEIAFLSGAGTITIKVSNGIAEYALETETSAVSPISLNLTGVYTVPISFDTLIFEFSNTAGGFDWAYEYEFASVVTNQVIRIEQKGDFLLDEISMNFSNVRDIESSYDQNNIFKAIRTGYRKGQSETANGLDDPQKRVTATRFIKTGKDIVLESDFIAAGLTIEGTRRTSRRKTADYKHDNDNFIIAINPTDISPDIFTPELNENFDSVTGINNPTKRYNLRLTPLRNFLRWGNVFGGCLQSYTDSSYKFVSGEGNYDLVTDYNCSIGQQCQAIICDSLSESADISLATYNGTIGYLHLPLLYTITIPMQWEEYQLIRNTRKKAIGISQTATGHVAFKIKSLEYNIMKGQATILAWPKTFLSIQVIEQDSDTAICY